MIKVFSLLMLARSAEEMSQTLLSQSDEGVSQAGHALIEVRYKGLLKELAEKISRIKSPNLQIVGMQSERLEIRFTE